jgi:hypothetical protein
MTLQKYQELVERCGESALNEIIWDLPERPAPKPRKRNSPEKRLARLRGTLIAVWYESGVRKRKSLGTKDVEEGRRRLASLKYKPRQTAKGDFIYFIQIDNADGFIKIGYANNLGIRISNIKVSCPYPVKILAVMEGKPKTEDKIHEILAAHCIKGEWYRPHDDVTAFIEIIIKQAGKNIWDGERLSQPVRVKP